MTGKEFLNSLGKGQSDIVQLLLDILAETGSRYCVIGGLAVNAYVDPVVSLDIDIVAAVEDVGAAGLAAKERGLKVEQFEDSVNIKGFMYLSGLAESRRPIGECDLKGRCDDRK